MNLKTQYPFLQWGNKDVRNRVCALLQDINNIWKQVHNEYTEPMTKTFSKHSQSSLEKEETSYNSITFTENYNLNFKPLF